jgi:hypothetical protein
MVCQLLFLNKKISLLGFAHCDRVEDVILLVHLSVQLCLVKADS